MKKWIREVTTTICVSYTIISVVLGYVNAAAGGEWKFYSNLLMMLVWTAIAVAVLYSHTLFDRWPSIAVMLVQYLIAMGLVFLTLLVAGLFGELHPLWHWHAFRSFTIPYIIGAAAFYVDTFRRARKANELLQEVRGQAEKE